MLRDNNILKTDQIETLTKESGKSQLETALIKYYNEVIANYYQKVSLYH